MQAGKRKHAAYSMPMEALDIVVVEDSKHMQTIFRSVLTAMRVGRIRIYDSPVSALDAMLAEPPNLILTDWKMEPLSGFQMLRLIRHKRMAPLCFVPILFVTAHGTRELVEKVLRAGAHHLLAKPISPSSLLKRLEWIVRDGRELELDEATGFYRIAGVDAALAADREKRSTLQQARQHRDTVKAISAREKFIEKQMEEQGVKAMDVPDPRSEMPKEPPKKGPRKGVFADVRKRRAGER